MAQKFIAFITVYNIVLSANPIFIYVCFIVKVSVIVILHHKGEYDKDYLPQ